MTERTPDPVMDPAFWKDRLYESFARSERHRAIYNGSFDAFAAVDKRQSTQFREIVRPFLGRTASVLDVGCGYGRLLDWMPAGWRGAYLGIDASPDLVDVARRVWPDRQFMVADVRQVSLDRRWDVAVAVWVRSMLLVNGLGDVWDETLRWMETNAENVVVIDED